MNIKFFCPRWGSEELEIKSFFAKVKEAGYDGVEMSLPAESGLRKEILMYLRQYDLQLIAQHWETMTSDYEIHKQEYQQRLENLVTFDPLFISSQTGKDYFTFEQNTGLIRIADTISDRHGVKIIHETHRSRFSFAAHLTLPFIEKNPDLRLCLDISHWCNVAESWLEDQPDAVSQAFSRTDHIHARIGFPEGPQIPDPRAPEWKEALDRYTGWWGRVIGQRREEGWKEFTVTPEFGPIPYMTILPFTKQPITNQWEVNKYMMDYLRTTLSHT